MPQVSGWLQVRFGEFGFVPIFGMVAVFYLLATLLEWQLFARSKRPLPTFAPSSVD